MKWIIDTDFSSNSEKALEILFKYKLDIVAITTTYGPSNIKPYLVKNSILEFLKKNKVDNIPVYIGATQSYINYQKELGDDDITDPYNLDTENLPKSNEIPKVNLEESASLKIIELCKIHGKDLNILTLSSLTNLSLSILLESNLSNLFNNLYVVGGSTTGIANSGNCAEANFRCDPVAAKNVVLYYSNLVLLPLEIEECIRKGFNDKLNSSLKSDLLDVEYVKKMYKEEKSIIQIIASLVIVNKDLIKTDIILPADVDIIGKFSRGALALEKYPWIESGTFSKISIIEELSVDNCLKVIFQ